MAQTIKCKNCGEEIEISDALKHQMEEQIVASLNAAHKLELEKIKKVAAEEAGKQISKQLADNADEIEALKQRAKVAEENELSMRKEKRKLAEEREKFEIEKERQMDVEREKIKREATLEAKEEEKFKIAELEKKNADMRKALEEAKEKGAQGSQQLQGEVLELDFENQLRDAFPDDLVVEVAKGKKGGDVTHTVRGKSGRVAGIIVWELKRAKWQSTFPKTLRENLRDAGASLGVLVCTELPKDISYFQTNGRITITSYTYAMQLAPMLRRSLLEVALAKLTSENKDENLEMLHEYIQSDSFRHRFESFAEGVNEMQADLDYEKRAMERVWKKRETQIKKMQINAARMYGELQGIMGNALADIKPFQLADGDDE